MRFDNFRLLYFLYCLNFFRLQNSETVGVRAGCGVEPVTLATFPPSSPGYVQLMHMDLNGRMEISFMFRTLQVC